MRRFVKDADKAIIAELKSAGRLVDSQTIVHSYPFCWRSETPLIYKAGPASADNVGWDAVEKGGVLDQQGRGGCSWVWGLLVDKGVVLALDQQARRMQLCSGGSRCGIASSEHVPEPA